MSPVPGPFAYGHPEMSYFKLMASNPARVRRFFQSMEKSEKYFPSARIYDFGWLVEKVQAEPERVVLVDVGGGKGHSLAATLENYPSLPRHRCVLEDREKVIKAVEDVNDPALSAVLKR